MENFIFSPINVAQLVDLIASEIESRIKKVEPQTLQQDRIGLRQATELVGLTPSAIYKLTMTGAIPFKKYGNRLVFSRQELDAWMEERTVRKQSPEEIASQQLARVARKRMPK